MPVFPSDRPPTLAVCFFIIFTNKEDKKMSFLETFLVIQLNRRQFLLFANQPKPTNTLLFSHGPKVCSKRKLINLNLSAG